MRVLHVVSTPPMAWATGGPARSTLEMCKELARRGHEITVATTDMLSPGVRYKGREWDRETDNLKILRFKYVSDLLAWKFKFYFSPGLISYLGRRVSEFDFVHINDLLSVHAIVAAWHCTRTDTPYMVSSHGSIPWFENGRSLTQLSWRIWGKRMLDNACLVTALTPEDRVAHERMGISGRKILILPNLVNVDDYSNLPSRGAFRRKIGVSNESELVLFLGRIHRIKGIDLLLDSFDDLAHKRRDIELAIVGPDDGFLAEIQGRVSRSEFAKRIHIVGPLYGQEKREAYVDADLYVLPSRYEAFGITVLEAALAGTPVVVTDRCGLSAFVAGIGGVAQFDRSSLESTIGRTLDDHKLREHVRNLGPEIVRSYFNRNRIVSELEEAYLKCLGARHIRN